MMEKHCYSLQIKITSQEKHINIHKPNFGKQYHRYICTIKKWKVIENKDYVENCVTTEIK